MSSTERETVFISKATPGDDEFVLWLAPRLEAAGYTVFADILTLEPGDRWRKEVTSTLQDKSIKMLLCCSNSTLSKNGVQEEIGIAEDLVKELNDTRFIIPLRLQPFKKLFGIGELQYIDFVGGWAHGLYDLLNALKKQSVPSAKNQIVINPNWEAYKRRSAIKIQQAEETLTSNWLRISKMPDSIRYYQPSGAIDHGLMSLTCKSSIYPAQVYLRGFFSFALPEEIKRIFANIGVFKVHSEHCLEEFLDTGSLSPQIRVREAKNLVTSMLRSAWEQSCREKGFLEYAFSRQLGFHVTKSHVALGQRVSWGQQSRRRNSMLRNTSRGKVWQFGVTASPSLWPFPHFKLKSRVLFAEPTGMDSGDVIKDSAQQHRLRRSVCSAWRNKAWHGRLMAFLKVFSDDSDTIVLPASLTEQLRLDSTPVVVTSPVTTVLPDELADDAEELDASTLGNFIPEEASS